MTIGGVSRPMNSDRGWSDLPMSSTDVGTGKQGAEPGDLTASDPRPYDPEAGIFDQVGLSLLDEFGGRHDTLTILAELDHLDFTHIDVLVFDLRLARLEPFAVLKLIVIVGPYEVSP